MNLRIGVDVGGTFTDVVGVGGEGRVVSLKVRSDPAKPSDAILSGLDALLAAFGAQGADVTFFGHGTTVVTNMIIEGKGARLAVLTTLGFRDVLALGRQARPHVYDYRVRRPRPLATRALRIEVRERVAADGAVLTPLSDEVVAHAIDKVAQTGAEAVAILFLHAYANNSHEAQLAAALRAQRPDIFVSASHEVAAEHREFERFSTTALNAFVGPRAAGYFDELGKGLTQRAVRAPPYTVTSNGGLIDETSARATPVMTALSGPAAGVMGIGRILAPLGLHDVVTFDVGGTSTDIAVIAEGTPRLVTARAVAGHPVLAPMVDIEVTGAGGGSLAMVGQDGALHVGPQSAGAVPGPAAYGLGGMAPTVTDAALVLGRIGANTVLGGRVALDAAKAKAAIDSAVGGPLGLSSEAAADGILAVAVANMARTIRSAITARGFDADRFALAAYGGAGPLFGADVAQALGIGKVVVPVSPGTLCARAILVGDIARHTALTRVRPLTPQTLRAVTADFETMVAAGQAWLAGEGIGPDAQRFVRTIDARYAGQGYEIAIPFYVGASVEAVRAAFDGAHEREQGFRLQTRDVELVTLRLAAMATPAGSTQPAHSPAPTQSQEPTRHGDATRKVVFGGTAHQTRILERDALAVGAMVDGPAIVEDATATTAIPPGWRAEVHDGGILVLTLKADSWRNA